MSLHPSISIGSLRQWTVFQGSEGVVIDDVLIHEAHENSIYIQILELVFQRLHQHGVLKRKIQILSPRVEVLG